MTKRGKTGSVWRFQSEEENKRAREQIPFIKERRRTYLSHIAVPLDGRRGRDDSRKRGKISLVAPPLLLPYRPRSRLVTHVRNEGTNERCCAFQSSRLPPINNAASKSAPSAAACQFALTMPHTARHRAPPAQKSPFPPFPH